MTKHSRHSTFVIPSSFVLRYSSFLPLLAALLPTYLIRFSIFGLPTNFFEVAVALTFLTGVLQPNIRRSWLQAYYSLPKPILISIFLFLMSAALSTAISPHLFTSLGILKSWVVVPIIFAWMVYASIRHSDFVIRHFVRALLLSGLVIALLGLSQLGTLDRIRGPYDVPNSLALFLSPLIVLATFWSLGFGHWSFSRSAAVIMFVALLFTQSLAGVVSVLIALTFGFLVIRKLGFVWSLGFGHWSLIAAALVIAAVVLVPKIEYLQQPGSSAFVRLQLWSISWDLIKDHPILGIGLGTFEPAYQQKLHERLAEYEAARQSGALSAAEPLREFVFRDPHNWVLSFWLNTGLLGLVSFIAIHVFAIRYSGLLHHSDFGFRHSTALALLTLVVFGLVDTIYWKNDLAALHWLLLSMMLTWLGFGSGVGSSVLAPPRRTGGRSSSGITAQPPPK